jgi:hypothetical protein
MNITERNKLIESINTINTIVGHKAISELRILDLLELKEKRETCTHKPSIAEYTGHVQSDDYYEIKCTKCGKVLKEWIE